MTLIIFCTTLFDATVLKRSQTTVHICSLQAARSICSNFPPPVVPYPKNAECVHLALFQRLFVPSVSPDNCLILQLPWWAFWFMLLLPFPTTRFLPPKKDQGQSTKQNWYFELICCSCLDLGADTGAKQTRHFGLPSYLLTCLLFLGTHVNIHRKYGQPQTVVTAECYHFVVTSNLQADNFMSWCLGAKRIELWFICKEEVCLRLWPLNFVHANCDFVRVSCIHT